ncbi:hypothetical protein DFH09DRAFT_1197038 [Mycena vulgaris]|nr:hypothetical protein DFH09DRAFT_1197038 [Mycena vulgaris]
MMTPLLTSSLKPPPTGAAGSKTGQFVDTATTTLEAAFKILQLLTVVTANVPYLNAITGCIQKLIEVQRVLSDNKKRADDLLNNVGVVSCAVSQGLCDLDERRRSIAVKGLHEDLQRYETVLIDTYGILRDWMSKGFVKRLWAHGDFAGIADGIDRRINAFRDAFSVGGRI